MPVSDEIPLHVRRSQTLPAHGQSTSTQNLNDDTDAQVSPEGLENAPSWKRELYSLFEQPNSSTAAFILHFSLTGLIVLSALVTVLETVPALHSTNGRVWIGLETSFVVLFTFEYIARSLAWSITWRSYFQWTLCACFILEIAAQ
jgi:potassium voltage-gated channel Shal-related subfamily D member 2